VCVYTNTPAHFFTRPIAAHLMRMSREALRSSMIGHRGMPCASHWAISALLTFIPVAFGTACGLAAQAIVSAFNALLHIRKI
jgi:hypothetical protein